VIPLVCTQPDRPAALVRAAVPVLPPMALQRGIGGGVLVWSSAGLYSTTKRTLSSSRSYVRVDDTSPISRHTECRTTLGGPAFERVTVALRASSPERWRPSYHVGAPPTPIRTPVPAPTSIPAVDVVAVVRNAIFIPHSVDPAISNLELVSAGTSYRTGFEYGSSSNDAAPISASLQDVTRAFDAADAQCRRPAHTGSARAVR
jgi:hypothetical protein